MNFIYKKVHFLLDLLTIRQDLQNQTGPEVILIPTSSSFAKILAKVVLPNPGGPKERMI
jgi:hypothetical protein